MSWLSGENRTVLAVSCDRPLFQLCVHQFDPQTLEDLSSATLASYPGPSPPAKFLKYLLSGRRSSEDTPDLIEARTDTSRLGLVVTRSVDAALVSSKISPPRLDRLGLSTADWLGDHLRIPTTGLAVTLEGKQELGDKLEDLVEVFRLSLHRIQDQPDTAVQSLVTYLGHSEEEARGTIGSIRSSYTREGTIHLKEIRSHVEDFITFIGQEVPGPLEDLYPGTDS